MIVQDLIDILNTGDTTRTLNFYHCEGGLADDQRQDISADDIDTSMDDVVDINIPTPRQ